MTTAVPLNAREEVSSLISCELPSPDIKTWNRHDKMAVVMGVWFGRLSREAACHRYHLSTEEFRTWEEAFKTYDYPDSLTGQLAVKDGLPSRDIKRWNARRKAAVVIAVSNGRMLRGEACRLYQLSEGEFRAWEDAFKTHGYKGLRATYLQEYVFPLRGLGQRIERRQ